MESWKRRDVNSRMNVSTGQTAKILREQTSSKRRGKQYEGSLPRRTVFMTKKNTEYLQVITLLHLLLQQNWHQCWSTTHASCLKPLSKLIVFYKSLEKSQVQYTRIALNSPAVHTRDFAVKIAPKIAAKIARANGLSSTFKLACVAGVRERTLQ